MKTATYSNGFTDTYKGGRNVQAGWMITNKETGRIIASGHSMTAQAAEKTAKSHHATRLNWHLKEDGVMKEAAHKLNISAKKLISIKRKENAEYKAKLNIEVVPL